MLATALWIVASVAVATFVTEVGFVYVMVCKRLDAKGLLRRDFRLNAYLLMPFAFAGDVWINLTRGTWMFREPPRELLFSSRIQRHVNESTGRDLTTALHWAAILNAIDDHHIRVPERQA